VSRVPSFWQNEFEFHNENNSASKVTYLCTMILTLSALMVRSAGNARVSRTMAARAAPPGPPLEYFDLDVDDREPDAGPGGFNHQGGGPVEQSGSTMIRRRKTRRRRP
jgi:hypothetical protein